MSRAAQGHPWRRRIERAVLGELSPPARRELHAALRGDPAARAEYDRAALALRVLEGDAAVAPYEVALVESWLVADLTEQAAAAASPAAVVARWFSWRTWLSVAAAAAVAILIVRMIGALPTQHDGDYDGIKGGGVGMRLALDVLCGDESAVVAVGGDALVSAERDGCEHDDTMAFSYALTGRRGGVLSLFGRDAQDNPMYYAPTPAAPDAIVAQPGVWRAVGAGVQLSVNHAAGMTHVYGLLSPRAPTIAQIDAIVGGLVAADAAGLQRTGSWLQRLARVDPTLSRTLCAQPLDCEAAEVSVVIRPAALVPTPEVSP